MGSVFYGTFCGTGQCAENAGVTRDEGCGPLDDGPSLNNENKDLNKPFSPPSDCSRVNSRFCLLFFLKSVISDRLFFGRI